MSASDLHSESSAVEDASSAPVSVEVGAHGASGAGYAVKLPIFEGPLDLLLHLIRQNEMEITEIQISLVGQQYLEYVSLMRDLNLDVAAEYLVMAATLALIKSRMLLPPEQEEEEDGIGDPRAELVARLLEYQRYKEVAEELAKRRLLGRDVFQAVGPGPVAVPDSERLLEVGLFELIEAFREVLQGAHGPSQHHQIEAEPVTVRERMLVVMEILEGIESIEFTQVFESGDGKPPTRPVLVATFLAILELARLTALRIYQGASDSGAPEGPIRLRRVEEGFGDDVPSWGERISELM